MAEGQHPAGGDDAEADAGQTLEGQPPPAPDEDGPHDVPDETVIEKTMPAAPLPDAG